MAAGIKLIRTGIAMGIVHVLTGPDHMSALATLSSSSSAEGQLVSKGYLFGLGARWGIGHSTGLLLVGGIFILKDVIERDKNGDGSQNGSDRVEIPDSLTHLFESFVGVFMLLLGFYGIYEAHRVRNREYSTLNQSSNVSRGSREEPVDYGVDGFDNEGRQSLSLLEIEAAGNSSDNSDGASPTVRDGPTIFHAQIYGQMDDDLEDFRYNVQAVPGTVSTEDEGAESSASNCQQGHHHHHHHHDQSNRPFLALCAGIFHGLAGPGGVLGVVPAIQLHNAGLAACYLLSFCVSTIVTMGTFSSAYGTFTLFLARC